MNTITAEIKTIAHHRTAYAVMLNYFMDELEKLTPEQRGELDGIDDYEDYGYTVINGDTVILDDDGTVIAAEPLQEFLQKTLAYLQQVIEGRE